MDERVRRGGCVVVRAEVDAAVRARVVRSIIVIVLMVSLGCVCFELIVVRLVSLIWNSSSSTFVVLDRIENRKNTI